MPGGVAGDIGGTPGRPDPRHRYLLRAYGGGVGLLGALGYGVILGEALLARRAIPGWTGAPLADGEYGEGPGPPLRLALLGDSSASGVGADRPEETPGARLAAGLAGTGRRVLLDVLAVSGSRSADLDPQVSRALLHPPHVAVVCVGANDVTHRVRPDRAAAALADAARRLSDAGARVVVGTCPDLGALAPFAQPLRSLARLRSRQMAGAQRRAAEAAGATVVPLGSLLGPSFGADPSMFCADRFHPSAAGYAALAAALLPAVRAAAEAGVKG